MAGVPARTAAELAGVNRNTAVLFYPKLREVISETLAERRIEVDKSYFSGHRKGKRGRGTARNVPVFGLLKRGGLVHAVMISDAKSLTLMGTIRERIKPDSIIYTDSFRAYDVLYVSEFQHHRINHINGIENFWNQAKRHLRSYNGIPKHHFHLFLKEGKRRFNYRASQ